MYKYCGIKFEFQSRKVLTNLLRKINKQSEQTDRITNSRTKIIKRGKGKKCAVEKDSKLNNRKSENIKAEIKSEKSTKIEEHHKDERTNEVNVQMLSKNLYEQLFRSDLNNTRKISSNIVKKCKQAMDQHSLNIKDCPKLPEVNLELPKLVGSDIIEHFHNISTELSQPYKKLIEQIVENNLPSIPKIWIYKSGWHKYSADGTATPVPFPSDDALVFDVEVCMSAGTNPVMACAVSCDFWFGWVSDTLIERSNSDLSSSNDGIDKLIPLESSPKCRGFNLSDDLLKPKIVVGHNVSFDRARVKEQYWMERTGARFLDTMAMHICVSGVTSYQRTVLKTKNKPIDPEDENWMQIASLNSLSEVHKLYCGTEISKAARDIFVDGTMEDVRENFQDLMTYCAGDVIATASVLKKLYPLFKERFPHPVTLAGMLELSTTYLPVNSNWLEYINNSDLAYEDIELEAKLLLARKANEACKLLHNDKYKKDMWMWDEDWSTQKIKLKKTPAKVKKADKLKVDSTEIIEKLDEDEESEDPLEKKFAYLYETKNRLPAVKTLLPGYPAWYKKLCNKPDKTEDWTPGPVNISTGMQVTPKLLSLTWEGFPLYFIRGQGWGLLVPFKSERSESDDNSSGVPFDTLLKLCPVVDCSAMIANENQSKSVLNNLWKDVEKNIGKQEYYDKAKKDKTDGAYTGNGIWTGVVLSDCCYFMKLPHKDGTSKRVGNPLARDFLNKFSENVLSGSGEEAQKVLSSARMLSYWRNNRDRIKQQKVMWLKDDDIPPHIVNSSAKRKKVGVILPQVVVCGTLTRRATESTWMTASNAQKERIGSELRAMVQSPPGFAFVGADVDSQELWIAAILGDSQFGIHGATPFGWMTLSGSKAAGTDMHSHTAAAANISRDHAKVINYARIYGAGQNFAVQLLKQFNPSISDGDVKSKAQKMFSTTKGKKFYRLKEEFIDQVFGEGNINVNLSMYSFQAMKIAKSCGKTLEQMFEKPKWHGGTESAMFNQLEEIAGSEEPKTPFLNCRLTRALMSDDEMKKRQLPTAINWVVQSGAVDFLHLMLVNMAWLTKSKARFCLSFHDEVRYMVPEEYKYNVALALHITNLFVRAFCAKRLGFDDLPQSVAFFSSVDVDTVLRKESHLDCITPSNPHGLSKGYGIPSGESLDVWETIDKSGGTLGKLFSDECPKDVAKDDAETHPKDGYTSYK